MRYTLTIEDWHPVRINQWLGKHWRTRHKLATGQAEMLRVAALCQHIPDATGRRTVTLEIHGPFRGGRHADADAYDKSLLDGLVKSRLLTDDDAKGLKGRMKVSFHKGPEKKTVIILEDC